MHRIFSSCSKSEALLLQPGDSLLVAGQVAASGNRWDHPALGKLLSVLMDDSESLGCVFRRPERPPGKRQGYVWYACGVSGAISTEEGSLGMLADHSVLVVPQHDTSRPAGHQLRVCFHHLRHGEVRPAPHAWVAPHACETEAPWAGAHCPAVLGSMVPTCPVLTTNKVAPWRCSLVAICFRS